MIFTEEDENGQVCTTDVKKNQKGNIIKYEC